MFFEVIYIPIYLIFWKVLEPNGHFRLEKNSEVHDCNVRC